jgi:hypothetical protein
VKGWNSVFILIVVLMDGFWLERQEQPISAWQVPKECRNFAEAVPNPGAQRRSLRYVAAMTRAMLCRMVILLLACWPAAVPAAEPALAIQGYDPVAYFTLQRATPGDARFAWDWDEHRWQFANAQHRDLFKADPARYAPQFASFCAVALSRGELKPANPEYWLISEGKLYLFGKSAGPSLFRKNLADNIEKARRNRTLIGPP